ncbi:suppressor of fused homolog [Ruditapes philippinarum]|uniref:suppressor of fused homolog n=1 Tax=Ruditapes philippinarum TaxID=129788 RepID=UPI00295AF25F|nr:suppressor of fused homolog [Ruditapes philippinarum]
MASEEGEDILADVSDVETQEDWEYAGLEAIDKACLEIYPDQINPLQATAVVKFWLGGPDPLDYISIYSNNGDVDRGIPPHWHYVSYGFSDLYGDNRVHKYSGSGLPSGYGFEMTMRLKKCGNESAPPMWPSGLMNRLANYVFQTGNTLHVGDHVPWHKPLDGCEESLVQHMLVAKDPQLHELHSPYGNLDFRQVVGVTNDEMKAAQRWKGAGVLELMSSSKGVGPYFITDLGRKQSIFEAEAGLIGKVNEGINIDGSNLGHVTAICKWEDVNSSVLDVENVDDNQEPECLEGVHLMFDSESADLLPMVIRGRLQKGRFFVFHNAENHTIHLIPAEFHEEGIYVNQTEPLKAQGSYLQIFCSNTLLEKMSEELECLHDRPCDSRNYPREFRFTDPTLIITVSPRGTLIGEESLGTI